MKKWVIILGVLVGLIILLLIQSDGRKILHAERTRLPESQSDSLSANMVITKHQRLSVTFSFYFTKTAD